MNFFLQAVQKGSDARRNQARLSEEKKQALSKPLLLKTTFSRRGK